MAFFGIKTVDPTKAISSQDLYNQAKLQNALKNAAFPQGALSAAGSGGLISSAMAHQTQLNLSPYKNISNRELICKWVLEFGYEPIAVNKLYEHDPRFMNIDQEFVIYKEKNQTLQLNEETIKRFNENV